MGQLISNISIQSTVNDIEKSIVTKRRGRIYFAADFASFGNPETVRKSLFRLEKSVFLVRLAHGIYLFPKIAKAITERDKARIVPTGVYALNALELSTQIPVNAVFLTDGAPRKIKIYNQRILLKHVVPKNFAYNSDVLMLVVSALKEIGNENVTDEDLAKIKLALSHNTKENILSDLKFAPAWIRKIIMPLFQDYELDRITNRRQTKDINTSIYENKVGRTIYRERYAPFVKQNP